MSSLKHVESESPRKTNDIERELANLKDKVSKIEGTINVDNPPKTLEKFWEIPSELKNYRQLWEKNIKNINLGVKNKIKQAANKINVKVNKDIDGSRLIEFKLWSKTYKILDPKLENHTDNKYRVHLSNVSSIGNLNKDAVLFEWMEWDNVEEWRNQKLKSYVKRQRWNWLQIPTKDGMKGLLSELWKQAWLNEDGDQIAMLMYLTGMDWAYWLNGWEKSSLSTMEEHISASARSIPRAAVTCGANRRNFGNYSWGYNWSLCMMSVK